ncbi:hypothetical protein D3C86_1785700 [compost metagenome]
MLRLERLGLDVALRRQRWPVFVPVLAVGRAIEMAGGVRIDFHLATFTLDHQRGVAEQLAGFAVHRLVTGVKDALQAAARR